MTINTEAIHTPGPGSRLSLHSLIAREARWEIILDDQILWTPASSTKVPWSFTLKAHIVGAGFVPGIDERLANQRDSIDRLTRHLKEHCPQLMGKGSCEHLPI